MKILVTAGGTAERIDDVRRITNSGTGTLGAKIAEAFMASGRETEIAYICTENAARPKTAPGAACEFHVCGDADSVKDAVLSVLSGSAFDIIVHSMAISDFKVRAVSDSAKIASLAAERLLLAACGDSSSPEEAIRDALLSPPEIKESKISSDRDDLIVVLEKAPKIIALLRGLAPEAIIVGFKLLSDVCEQELLRAGHALLLKNECDFVFANDMKTIGGGGHEGILIDRDMAYTRASGKDGIAALIVSRTLSLLQG